MSPITPGGRNGRRSGTPLDLLGSKRSRYLRGRKPNDMVFSSFFRKWREKRRTGVVATVKPQPEPPDDMDWFFPPRNVHDHALWDRYWQDQVTHGLTPPLFDMLCSFTPLVPALIKRGAKRLLCAGNGISQEPRALAAAGFEVTAMDLSPAAAHFAETWQFSSTELDSFCTKEQRMSGGSLRFVVGDILDRSLCPGPFDAIIEHRTLQLFPEEERGLAVDALASRLKIDGLLVSHRHNQLLVWPSIVQLFRDRGWSFYTEGDRGWPFYTEDLKVPDHDGRVVWLIPSTG